MSQKINLLEVLIGWLQNVGLQVPSLIDHDERVDFAIQALAKYDAVPSKDHESLRTAAFQVVHSAQKSPVALPYAIAQLERTLNGEDADVEPSILIIFQGGLVQAVIGVPPSAYETCDLDVFEDDPPQEALEYFKALSESMKRYLLGSEWACELPEGAAELKVEESHEVATWENEGGQIADYHPGTNARRRSRGGRHMQPHDTESSRERPSVLPLPYALYDSNGLLFELYQGGQPTQTQKIFWEKIRPIRLPDSKRTQQSQPQFPRAE